MNKNKKFKLIYLIFLHTHKKIKNQGFGKRVMNHLIKKINYNKFMPI